MTPLCAVRARVEPASKTPQIAAMFARVNPQKDYDTLIAAAARLRTSHPQLYFVIVGDNALVPQNRQHFERIRISPPPPAFSIGSCSPAIATTRRV
jgi:glycosyltransferase involved in cell wall biosynthesis